MGSLVNWLWIAFAYLCGSIPFGLLITRAASGKDVRTVGSGNIGATNVARAAGKPAAVATLVLDAVKGLVPVLLAARSPAAPPLLAPACAVAAVVGHCFPPWLRFRGGKGVATGLGVALALAPWAALAGALTWAVLFKLFRISSIGSLSGMAVALAVAALTSGRPALVGMAGVALLILIRHQANIRRLLHRQES
ncbi:MAG TPA: glycerol-3-phosphate 1-O-acyltransferase PlsY [Myxococcales bacterium]|nr:glycerol-3-phosphate 1-O-acyltransferase PlsY [Myxococcales bacterium]